MTTYFVSNAGSNTAPYDTEAKAATSLGTVIAVPVAATDVIKVSSTHTENAGASITYTLPTSPGLQVLSVTFNGSGTGGLASGGSITTGGNSGMTINGYGYFYGLSLTVGAGGNSSSAQINLAQSNSASHWQRFDNCTFYLNTTSATPILSLGRVTGGATDADSTIVMNDCVWRFAATGIKPTFKLGYFNLRGLSFHASSSVITTLFTFVTGGIAIVDVTASDLSAMTSAAIVDISSKGTNRIRLAQCKFPSGFALTTGSSPSPGSTEVIMQDCDSGDNHYTFVKAGYGGTVTQQNSIYADASNGTDNLGWTMVASGNATFLTPLEAPSISYWNATLSAMTTTVEAASNNVTFKDNELWQETLAKVTSGFTLGTWNVGDRAADVLAAGANQTTSAKSWTGVPGTPVMQKLVTTSFTPAEVGPIRTRAYLGKASATAYVSPRVLSGNIQWMTAAGEFINEQASAGSAGMQYRNLMRGNVA